MTDSVTDQRETYYGSDAVAELASIREMISKGDQVPWAIPMGFDSHGAYKIAGITPRADIPDFTELVVAVPQGEEGEVTLGLLPCHGLYDHRDLTIEVFSVRGTKWWVLSEAGDMGYFDLAVCLLPQGAEPPQSISREDLRA